MRRWLLLILCLFMLPCTGHAMEGAYLTGEDLKALEPAFEAFVEELADVLIARGLLQDTEREAWVMYQLGDYLQNGGFGTIAVMYTPGLLGMADEAVTMRRFSSETSAGTLALETLRRYAQQYSPLPGLPLDVELTDGDGAPVPCRFRWVADDGSFFIWDGAAEQVVEVGATYIGDGEPLYWYAEPAEGIEATLSLEILEAEADTAMASVSLRLISGDDHWAPEALE